MTEEIQISAASVIAMGAASAFGFLLPVALWIIWRKKTGASWIPLIAGLVGFIFIGTMRGMCRAIFLSDTQSTPMLYYFMQAVLAGVFEEGGKYLVMRFAIPNHDQYRDPVSYGIGHSAVEHYAVGGGGLMLYGFAVALFYRTGDMDALLPGGAGAFLMDGLDETGTLEALRSVSENTVFSCIRGMLESIPVLHICCSVLVFTAVHYDRSPKWLLAAVGLHILCDVIGAFYMAGHISHAEANVLELLFDAGLIYLTWRVWQHYRRDVKWDAEIC